MLSNQNKKSMHSIKRFKHRYQRLSHWLVFGLGLCLFAMAATVYWCGDAEARYVWRQWHSPALAIALDRSDAPLMMEIGNAYFGAIIIGRAAPRYNPALAERAFEKALLMSPGILWGHYSLARIAFARGDFTTALVEVNAELTANPENLRSLYIRGLIYGYRNLPGDLALAEADFTRFVAWTPTEWAGYNDLAWILAKEGKYAEVESVMTRALTKVSDAQENPWLWNMLGVARLNLGDDLGAAVALTNALTYARSLTLADWREAYSGNSPAGGREGLEAFRAGIEENLAKVKGG